jgi:hypothetical protein
MMTVNEWLRVIAGTFVLLSLAMGEFWHPGWYLFTAFVAFNLIQSAFSKWCPMMTILHKLGVREECPGESEGKRIWRKALGNG